MRHWVWEKYHRAFHCPQPSRDTSNPGLKKMTDRVGQHGPFRPIQFALNCQLALPVGRV